MSDEAYNFGTLVDFLREDRPVTTGIVSKPIHEDATGHVLIFQDGAIIGLDASMKDVRPADENSTGYAQLGYHLIKLGSLVIEQKLIVYRT
jgi:hypothetical protein